MSAGTGSATDPAVVYVRLLDEGTDVWRPTRGEPAAGGALKLLATEGYDPEDEKWEFPPGSVVRCERRKMNGADVWVAVGLAH